jgi:hypothetical protein
MSVRYITCWLYDVTRNDPLIGRTRTRTRERIRARRTPLRIRRTVRVRGRREFRRFYRMRAIARGGAARSNWRTR